jgi:hypothetical protein
MGADELFAIEILYLIEREKWLKSAHMFNSIYVNKSLPHSLSEPGLTVMKEIISRFVINDLKAPPMDYAAVNLLRDPGSNLPDNIDVAFTILGILGPDSYLALTNNIGEVIGGLKRLPFGSFMETGEAVAQWSSIS